MRQPQHPDPLAEAVRWSISEGAVLQAIGRARGVRRGADRPVHVTVLAAMALPVTVHEVATWEAVQPDRLEVAAAEAALNNRALPLAPADLQAARPDLWGTPKAAERDLERREGDLLTAETPPKPLVWGSWCQARSAACGRGLAKDWDRPRCVLYGARPHHLVSGRRRGGRPTHIPRSWAGARPGGRDPSF